MKKTFTTKISLQSSNPTYLYPLIRLPRTLKDLAGETVSVYQTEKDGSLAFFIAHKLSKLDNLDKFIEEVDQKDQNPKNAPIDQSTSKDQWARPDSDRRPPQCQGGRCGACDRVFRFLRTPFWHASCRRNDNEKCKHPLMNSLIDSGGQTYKL